MIMKDTKKIGGIALFSILFAAGLALRLLFLPAKTLDMLAYIQWYDQIARHGIIPSLSAQSFGYNPPFIYLLALATLTQSFLPKIIAIKLIPLTFDIFSAALVFQIVKTQHYANNKPMLAALLFWSAPTILINSSFWGQTDSLYTCFLLLAIFYLLKERPAAAVIAFALSISVKAQGIFLAPLLGILFLQKRIRWHNFLLIPLVYVLSFLPTVLAGRPLNSIFSTYAGQGETFSRASMNAANFYFFVGPKDYQSALFIGIPLAALLLLIWVLLYGRKVYPLTPNILVFSALLSVALTPFLLPKMHDRYFYPADVFSLIAAFFIPGTWFLPIAYQIISLLSYMPYLFALRPQGFIPAAAWLNFLVICFLLWRQWKMTSGKKSALT
jgi:Gpi18-like mannosyltransferase